MIEVLEEKEAPRAEIVCSNCGSKLRYGNADLYVKQDYTYGIGGIANHYLICPVCGCEINASWIVKDSNSGN